MKIGISGPNNLKKYGTLLFLPLPSFVMLIPHDFSVKKGGPNPISNTVLAAVLEKAKELDVPKEILERNIKRASERGQEAYIEKVYEVSHYL